MSGTKKYPSEPTEQRTEQREPERDTRLPPLKIGVYAVECPVCHARAGEWCRACLTLPYGIALSHAHDRRIGEAAKRKLI